VPYQLHSTLTWLATGAGAAIAAYAAYVAVTWTRFGRVAARQGAAEADPILDRFMPVYDIVERHHVDVDAPAPIVFAAAKDADLIHLPMVRAIVKGRELIMGASPVDHALPHGIVEETRALGWGVLEELPGQEIVLGAVTRPWQANVTFRAVAPERFAAFAEPEYVKIVWNLRADAISSARSRFLTETRALATDALARRRFRRYWSLVSPGIILIRWLALGPVKAEAERRARLKLSAEG
jgi:hypothetical protein